MPCAAGVWKEEWFGTCNTSDLVYTIKSDCNHNSPEECAADPRCRVRRDLPIQYGMCRLNDTLLWDAIFSTVSWGSKVGNRSMSGRALPPARDVYSRLQGKRCGFHTGTVANHTESTSGIGWVERDVLRGGSRVWHRDMGEKPGKVWGGGGELPGSFHNYAMGCQQCILSTEDVNNVNSCPGFITFLEDLLVCRPMELS